MFLIAARKHFLNAVMYRATCMYNFTFSIYYVYNGFHVFDFIAHCWASFSALRALLSSHIMTNKDDDDGAQANSVVRESKKS